MKFGQQYPAILGALNASTTPSRLDAYTQQVFGIYDDLAAPLPDSSMWKLGKPAHARKVIDEVADFSGILGLDSPIMIRYLSLACAAHDLGRMVQGNRRAKIDVSALLEKYPSLDDTRREIPYDDNDQRHGYETVLLLKPVLGDFAETDPGKWLLTAMLHHSLKENPSLEMCDGSNEALGISGVVRDIDKVVAFNHDVRDYTENPVRKLRERNQNFGGKSPEMELIFPERFLFEVPFITLINRQECESYETYMLQFLKWLFGFMREDMQDMAIAGGGPQLLVAYLLKQLQGTPHQHDKLLAEVKAWRGGILLG